MSASDVPVTLDVESFTDVHSTYIRSVSWMTSQVLEISKHPSKSICWVRVSRRPLWMCIKCQVRRLRSTSLPLNPRSLRSCSSS